LGSDAATPPLIAHIIHRLDVGGMENGVVNLINHLPLGAYRHAIICMTDYTDFSRRIQRQQVSLHALHKREGKDLAVHKRLWRLLRQLKPDIVHTRNMATLEAQATAVLAGVRRRVHGEHGWDVGDLDGSGTKNQRLRRLFRPLVHHYIALSRHQLDYLRSTIGIEPQRLNPICNGVDIQRFRPRTADTVPPLPEGFAPPDTLVIGTVMRMQPVKAPLDLVQAFIALRHHASFPQLRLVMIGDGPLRSTVQQAVNQAGIAGQVWLPGARDDIPELLRGLDLFVLPSLAEGICNTVLEAMATGLPVIATQVGGNPDLIVNGETGSLVPPGQPLNLAQVIAAAVDDPPRRHAYGQAARQRAETEFSIATMVQRYDHLYRVLLAGRQGYRDAA